MERANLFKRKKTTFVSEEARMGRALEQKQERNHKRAQQFNQVRAVPNIQEDGGAGANLDRKKRLEMWKAQKTIKKKIEAANKKPAFVVGVTRHKIYSPKSADPPLPHCHGKKNPPKKPSPVKKITRATAKRLAAKAKGEVVSKSPGVSKSKSPGIALKSKTPSKQGVGTPLSRKFASIAPENYVFKPPPSIEPIRLQTETVSKKELSSRISELISSSFKSRNDGNLQVPEINGKIFKSSGKSNDGFNFSTTNKIIDEQNGGSKVEDFQTNVEPNRIIDETDNQSKSIANEDFVKPEGKISKSIGKKSKLFNSTGKIKVSDSPAVTRSRRINKRVNKPELENLEAEPKDLEIKNETVAKDIQNISKSPVRKPKVSRSKKNSTLSSKSELENLKDNLLENIDRSNDTINITENFEPEEVEKVSKSPAKKSKISRSGRSKTINQTESESDNCQLNDPEIPKTPNNKIDNLPEDLPILAEFSPYIVTGRGKSARKEQRDRLLNNSFGGEIPTKDTVQMLNESSEDNIKTAKYYKYLLQQETEKLVTLCDKWKQIREQTPGEGYYIIHQAVGQSELLIQKKFQRFSKLADECESNNQESLVRSQDLRGFWEMMEPEIRNCHDRFANVEKLKERNWEEDEEVPVEVKKKGKRVAKPKLKPKLQGKSNMKAFIEAARKRKLQEQDDESQGEETPKGRVLRSRVGKTPEVKLDSSISYINSDQTPGKSILKKKREEDAQGLNKSVTKVNFSINNLKNDEIVKTLEYNQEPEEVPSKAAQMLIQKLFSNNRGLSNAGRVNVKVAKALKKQGESPAKTPRRKSRNSLAEKENATTPRRRSSRKSIRLNVSDECTAC